MLPASCCKATAWDSIGVSCGDRGVCNGPRMSCQLHQLPPQQNTQSLHTSQRCPQIQLLKRHTPNMCCHCCYNGALVTSMHSWVNANPCTWPNGVQQQKHKKQQHSGAVICAENVGTLSNATNTTVAYATNSRTLEHAPAAPFAVLPAAVLPAARPVALPLPACAVLCAGHADAASTCAAPPQNATCFSKAATCSEPNTDTQHTQVMR